MDAAAIKAYADRHLEGVFHLMEETLSSDVALLDATNRSVLDSGGKRIRPLLTLLSAGACGERTPDTDRVAAAAEILHNATLLHDDVVDGAATRRGRPTVMSQLGGHASVLIGDYWLARAMNLILDTESHTQDYIRLLSRTLDDLARGEILQLQKSECCDTAFEDYLTIIRCKTASLFEACARTGALSGNASGEQVEALGRYASNLGIAFQIKDDILDFVGGDIGKPAGQDLEERKVTMPLLSALATVPENRCREIRARLAEGGHEQEILAFVRAQDGTALAQEVLESYIDKAVGCLAVLPESEEKRHLVSLARYSSIRKQ